jgi:hypothetical protein
VTENEATPDIQNIDPLICGENQVTNESRMLQEILINTPANADTPIDLPFFVEEVTERSFNLSVTQDIGWFDDSVCWFSKVTDGLKASEGTASGLNGRIPQERNSEIILAGFTDWSKADFGTLRGRKASAHYFRWPPLP